MDVEPPLVLELYLFFLLRTEKTHNRQQKLGTCDVALTLRSSNSNLYHLQIGISMFCSYLPDCNQAEDIM